MERSARKLFLPIIGLMMAGIVWSAAAQTQSAFEGLWTGKAKAAGADVGKGTGAAACMEATLEVTISGDRARGSINLDDTYFLVQGKVEADGSVIGFVGDDPLTGKFSKDGFVGSATAMELDCKRDITMTKR